MTKEELDQFKELAKKYERGKDKEAVLKVISEDIHEVFQEVNDRGHSAATKAKQADIDSLSEQLTKEKARADELDRQVKNHKEAPDIATMREKYEENERKLRDEHQKALDKLTTDHKAELQQREKALINTRLEVAKKTLVDKLTDDKIGVDRDYAETIIVNRPEVVDRLKVEADGSVKVLKKGSTDMFITPAEGRTGLDHLAEEVGETVEAKWKTSGTGRGSGTSGSSGGSNGSNTERFEATRKRVQEREQEAAKTKAAGSGLERLGSRR